MRRELTPGSPEWDVSVPELGTVALPTRLYVEGETMPPQQRAVAIVGTRRPTGAGREIARDIASRLAQADFAIVSGLALGIDTIAHQAALDAGGHTVAVMGCGLDMVYPKQNAKLQSRIAREGTLISEYPLGTPSRAAHFPERNRIIAAISRAVVVVEGASRSGALITARYALGCRDVYAVPGSIRNPMSAAPNELIRTDQARLITSADHIFEDLAPSLVWHERSLDPRTGPPLEPLEAEILLHLDDSPTSMGRVCADVEAPAGQVALTLARLEVRGLVVKRSVGYELTTSGARARGTA